MVPPSPHSSILLPKAIKQNGHLGNTTSKKPGTSLSHAFLPALLGTVWHESQIMALRDDMAAINFFLKLIQNRNLQLPALDIQS
jgi:hypothetical protein